MDSRERRRQGAHRLRRDQLTGNTLFLYTQKTGQPVRVPLPDFVAAVLRKLTNDEAHFFWTFKNIRSAVANRARYLASVFDLAKVKNGPTFMERVYDIRKGISNRYWRR